MEIAVELSLYPLDADYIPPIKAFLERIHADPRVKIVTSSMSTQVIGRYEDVLGLLTQEMRAAFEQGGKAVFVMKVLGPLQPAQGEAA